MITISPEQLSETEGRLIDVRNPDEFASGRLSRAECIPLGRLASEASNWKRDDKLLVMCKSGIRSVQAAQQLEALGFAEVINVGGGIEACRRSGLDIVRDRKTIPIFRQVMIWAGFMLVLGLALAALNPWFLGITWFVSGGLVFAGVTGYCPMAKVLEHMPWNRAPGCPSGSC
jgi:rhodanese-related sulfurtransferase